MNARRLSLLLALVVAQACGGSTAEEVPVTGASPPPVGRPVLELVSTYTQATNPDWCGDELVYQKRRFLGCRGWAFCSEVYRVRPFDASPREVCLTCNISALEGAQHKGTPDWHPSCEYVLFTANNRFATGLVEEEPSFAINSDLWIVDRDGTDASSQLLIRQTEPDRASLHPRFSPGGDYIAWTDRVPPSDATYCLGQRRSTPGCTNPWRGWFLAMAKLERSGDRFSVDGDPFVFSDGEDDPDRRGMYETGELYGNGQELWLYYSRTRCGQNGDPPTVCGYEYQGDDMRIRFDTGALSFGMPEKIVGIEGEWSEKLQEVGDGIHWSLSSSHHSRWNFFNPGDSFANLGLEVHLVEFGTAEQIRLTSFNDPASLASFAGANGFDSCSSALASDHAWSSDSRYFASNATYLCLNRGLPAGPPTLNVYRNLGVP